MGLPAPRDPDSPPAQTTSAPPEIEKTPRVALVAEPESEAASLRGGLERAGYEVLAIPGAEPLLACLDESAPDLVLLDASLGGDSPYELCGEIRTTGAGRLIPLVLVNMANADEGAIAEGLLAGADDYCMPSTRPHEFMARVRVQLRNKRVRDRLRRVKNERDHWKNASKFDALTGLLNRGSFDTLLSEAMMGDSKFAVLFIDVDHFKAINDRLGHDTGDEVLRLVAKCISKSARGHDHCGRYGGEEFVVFVAGCDENIAPAVAERHRANIEALAVAGLRKPVTASVGVAVFDPAMPDLTRESLYKRADTALYRAKNGGRNCVMLAHPCGGRPSLVDLPAPTLRTATESGRRSALPSLALVAAANELASPPITLESSVPSEGPDTTPEAAQPVPAENRAEAPMPPDVSVAKLPEPQLVEPRARETKAPEPKTVEPKASEPKAPEPKAQPAVVPEAPRPATPKAPVRDTAELEALLLRSMSRRAGLPLLPEAAQQALRLARDPGSDMHKIAKLVERDPTLAARFLALANSPLYSAGSRAVSAHTALVRLGLATARDLLLQVVYERNKAGLTKHQAEVERSFARSVVCALATVEVARAQNFTFADAYLCGLLHDIGEGRVYRVLAGIDGEQSPESVKKLVDRHHVRAGAEIARSWNLPEAVIDCCENHHKNPKQVSPRVRVVMIADLIANAATQTEEARSTPAFSPEQQTQLAALSIEPKLASAILQGVFVAGRISR